MNHNNTAIIEQEVIDMAGLDILDGFMGTSAADVIKATADEDGEDAPVVNVLKPNGVNDILDKSTPAPKKKEAAPATVKEPENKVIADKETLDILDNVGLEVTPDGELESSNEDKTAGGRPKTEKNSLVSYLAAKITADEFGIPEDAKFDAKTQKIEDYLAKLPEKELHELLDNNLNSIRQEVIDQTPAEFFESLPEELQYAARYVAEGGQDMKALFKALSHVEEIKALDPEKESDQLAIARAHLQATKFGTPEQIEEQIEEWKDGGKLPKKAKEFKPALDTMQKQQVEAQIKIAEQQKAQQQKLAEFYSENVFKTLEKNELAGIKLDKKFARSLGDSMVTTVPGPWSGKPVNYLGYGLEKAQYIEPNYNAVMLAAWILNDMDNAIKGIKQLGGNENAEKTVKLIKLAQGQNAAAAEPVTTAEPKKEPKRLQPNMANVLRKRA